MEKLSPARPNRFSWQTLGWLALLLSVFWLAAFLRFYDLANPPLDFHPTRQLFGAMRARAIFYQNAPNIPTWNREMAQRQLESEVQLEPLVMENLAAFAYRYTGESTAIPRAFSGAFWLIGGIFLLLLTINLTGSRPAALVSLLFYFFLPYALPASRSFQPDPLMIMLVISFWWSLERWAQASMRSWAWAIAAALFGGLAIYIKLTAAFFVLGGAVGGILAYGGLRMALSRPQTWLLAVLGALPGGAYLYYGIFVKKFLAQEFSGRTYPAWWVSPNFYLRWLDKLDNLIPLFVLALALAGLILLARRETRLYLGSIWGAYLLFGLIQTHHIASHDYYSLPAIPLTALSLGPVAAAAIPWVWQRAERIWQRAALILIILVAFFTHASELYLGLRLTDYRPAAATYAEIGEKLRHEPGVLALTSDYGYQLEYYGWQNTSLWPLAEEIDDFNRAFRQRTQGKAYFLVTDFDELKRQPELAAQLNTYVVLAQTHDYVIYDLKNKK